MNGFGCITWIGSYFGTWQSWLTKISRQLLFMLDSTSCRTLGSQAVILGLTNSSKNGRPDPSILTSTSSLPDELNLASKQLLVIICIIKIEGQSNLETWSALRPDQRWALQVKSPVFVRHPRSMVSVAGFSRIYYTFLKDKLKVNHVF